MVYTELSCKQFLATGDAVAIAAQLRDDQERARQGYLPSVLARYMPRYSSQLSKRIAKHLAVKLPEEDNSKLDGDSRKAQKELERLQYEGVIRSLRAHLKTMNIPQVNEEAQEDVPLPQQAPLRTDEVQTALKVIESLMSPAMSEPLNSSSTIDDVLKALKYRLGPTPSSAEANGEPSLRIKPRQKCYICRYIITKSHPEYERLCWQCGEFNISESKLSLPENLSLTGRTALVTGGRVKLGFYIALRLLRCGAHVIVSSRYPRDAEARYLAEPDVEEWRPRLKVVGADFRTARDVFRLVTVVRAHVQNHCPGGRLDILINNAAQTLTDPVAEENKALRREQTLKIQGSDSGMLVNDDAGYTGQVRGGQLLTWASGMGIDSGTAKSMIKDVENVEEVSTKSATETMQLTELPIKTSWTQSITEIPYEDVITAYSVNALSVHILICELLPLMASPQRNDGETDHPVQKANAYIVNVSSREGIFEQTPSSGFKSGKHVHTNTSKAALNMITETEAWPCWRDRRVAMNTVDPGYMSASPEFEHQGPCPIGFEDGAGRVLWPIAQGELGSKVVWGRFLKHYGKVDVHVAAGRG